MSRARKFTWGEIRHALGASRDRRKWLQFHCAVTSYRPFPWQIRAHLADSGSPYVRTNKLVTAGIRTGKSVMTKSEGQILVTVNPGVDHFVIAPTYDQVREVLVPGYIQAWEEMAGNGYPILKKMRWSILRADLYCGGRVFFRSADKVDNLRGFEAATALIDEADYCRNPMDTLDTIIGRISAPRAYVRQFTCTTTPAAYAGSVIEHWHVQRQIATLFEDPAEREQVLRAWWHMRATTLDNPTLPRDFLDGVRSYSKRRYLSEIMGCIAANDNARVWPEFGDKHVIDYEYNPRRPYDLGIDWALRRPAYVWIQQRGDGSAVIFDQWVEDDIAPDRQLAAVMAKCEALGRMPFRAAVDRNDPQMISKFQRMFSNTQVRRMESKSDQSRAWSAEAVRELIDPLYGKPRLYIDRALTGPQSPKRGAYEALLGLAWETRSDGIALEVPLKDGVRDHIADAVSYWAKAFGVDGARAHSVRMRSLRGAPSMDEIRHQLFGRENTPEREPDDVLLPNEAVA